MRTNEELVKEIQEGRREEMPVLWEQVYRFVCLQAHRWKRAWENRPGFEVDDLTQSGYIALCEAVQEYRPEKSMSFINYFSFFLKREFKKVSGCNCKRQLNEPLNNAVSLDAPASNDTEELSLGDTIEAEEPGFEAVEKELESTYTANVVREALRSLPELERFAIEERYFNDKTFVEIGEEVGRNFSTIRHYTKQGLKSSEMAGSALPFRNCYGVIGTFTGIRVSQHGRKAGAAFRNGFYSTRKKKSGGAGCQKTPRTKSGIA